jgi:hypothetical protein
LEVIAPEKTISSTKKFPTQHNKVKHVLVETKTKNIFKNFFINFNFLSGGISTDSINIENFIDLRGESNVELLMRVSTDIDNEKTLHTDLNGLSMSRKKYHDKLHIQGNVYPIVTAAFIEDQTNRINILSKQASGISSQNNGQIEVF